MAERGRPVTWLDVFTATPLTGNGLAVVHDADDLDDATMLAIARETRLSETTFVQSPQRTGADYRNRIWTVTHEIPLGGHPSLGTAVAVARRRNEATASYVQQTPAGLQPIDVEIDGDSAHASMLQEPPEFLADLDPDTVLKAAGLTREHAHPDLPPQVVSTGAPQLICPVSNLDDIAPDPQRTTALIREHNAIVLYLVTVQGTEVQARSFLPDAAGGLTEDPATGAAAGPLIAYLHRHTGTTAITIEQGVAVGRPSRLQAAIHEDRVKVGGDVVIVAEGRLLL